MLVMRGVGRGVGEGGYSTTLKHLQGYAEEIQKCVYIWRDFHCFFFSFFLLGFECNAINYTSIFTQNIATYDNLN